MPPVSSSGAGVVSAALSGTDRAGTKREIKCIGAQPARIKRACRDFYLPRRNSAADRERDQELLSEILSDCLQKKSRKELSRLKREGQKRYP